MAEQSRKVPFWRSLQTQFALTYIVIIAAVLLVLNLYPVLVYQDLVFQSKQTSLLQDQASVIAATLAGPEVLSEKSAEGAVSLLGGNVSNRRVMVTDPTGLVLYDSSEVNNAYGQYALLQEITSALKGNDVFRSEFRDGAFRSRAAVPVAYLGMNIGAVYVYEYDAEGKKIVISVPKRACSSAITVIIE